MCTYILYKTVFTLIFIPVVPRKNAYVENSFVLKMEFTTAFLGQPLRPLILIFFLIFFLILEIFDWSATPNALKLGMFNLLRAESRGAFFYF